VKKPEMKTTVSVNGRVLKDDVGIADVTDADASIFADDEDKEPMSPPSNTQEPTIAADEDESVPASS